MECALLLAQVRFVVMGSVFPTEVRLHRKYDLKGSTHGRTVGAKKLADPNTCLKVLPPEFFSLHNSSLPWLLGRLVIEFACCCQR